MVGTIDLNAATAPTNVPVNPVITATFTTDVDATTATTSNVTLTEDYDNVSIPLTIAATGKVVTITPTANLANGALYKLAITNGLKATDGQASHSCQPFLYYSWFIPSFRSGCLLEL